MPNTAILFDTHAHLTHKRLGENIGELIAQADSSGVKGIICAAADVAETQAALQVARQYENVFFTSGIHPHEAKDATPQALERILQLAQDEKCVAVGEIGLDYHYDFSPRPAQHKAFEDQLQIAIRLDRPAVIHSREAFDDTWAIIKNSNVHPGRIVFHSFTYEKHAAEKIIDAGMYISYSGIITFSTAEYLREAALITPIEKMFVETDCPFLSPVPVRKMKDNTPANVVHVAECLAELKKMSFEDFCAQTSRNAQDFFKITLV